MTDRLLDRPRLLHPVPSSPPVLRTGSWYWTIHRIEQHASARSSPAARSRTLCPSPFELGFLAAAQLDTTGVGCCRSHRTA